MTEIDRCKRALARAEAAVIRAREALRAALGKTVVKCTTNSFGRGCGVEHEIGNLTFIQTHHYIYRPGEGQFICPSCQHRNKLYDRPEIELLKYSFGGIVSEHDR